MKCWVNRYCHLSLVTCHLSHFTCPNSLVTFNLSQADTIEEMLGEYRARHAKSDPETPEEEQYIDYRSRRKRKIALKSPKKGKTDFYTFENCRKFVAMLEE